MIFKFSDTELHHYSTLAIRGLRIISQLSRILALLNHENIPVILMKGSYLAHWLYRDIALRPMTDIDILVPKNQANQAYRILLDSGYSEKLASITFQSHIHQQVAFKRRRHLPTLIKAHGIQLEIHQNIFEDDFFLNSEMKSVWESAIPVKFHRVTALKLSPEYLLRRHGMSQARVTQIINLLKLSPEIREEILNLPDKEQRFFTERRLRKIAGLSSPKKQIQAFINQKSGIL